MEKPERVDAEAAGRSMGWVRDLGWMLAVVAGLGLAGWWLVSATEAPQAPRDERLALIERTVPAGEASAYVGDAECARCHEVEARAHAASGHAHTFHRAANHPLSEWLVGKTVEDPELPGSEWSYRVEEGQLVATHRQEGKTEEVVLDLAMGSGTHAVTFVSVLPGEAGAPEGLEHRLSLFPEGEEVKVKVTPGEGGLLRTDPDYTALGRHLNAFLTRRCVECHTTITCAEGVETLDVKTLIPQVSCERCHGPGREHSRRAEAHARDLAMPFGNGRNPAEEQVRLCGDCHRMPSFAPVQELWPGNPSLVRFQPIGMTQSACYRKSLGSMRCTSCHDPHGPTMRDDRAYEASCLACHDDASETHCPVSPTSGCVGCHMNRHTNDQGLTFTDHWIRVLRPEQRRSEPEPEAP